MPKLTNGFLVVFDGIDGVGKTTQLQLAQHALSENGWTSVARRNMGGTPIGEELRKVMIGPLPRPSETNLYISAAVQAALIEQVDSDRQDGSLILMDRGPISLAAYEIFGSGLDEGLAWPHVDHGMTRLKPDLTIIYRIEVGAAMERLKKSNGHPDYFESKPPDYFERVAKGYEAAAQRYGNVVIIDANRPIDGVHSETTAAILEKLPKSA